MNFKKLETFIMVVEKKSFSEAASTLKSSQPTVSLQVKSLEEELGFELLDRSVSGMRLTPAGILVYQAATEMAERWQRLEDNLSEFRGTLTGALTIGASTIPGSYLLPGWIKSFKEHYPKVDVRIEIGDSKTILEQLYNHEIDAAIIGMKQDSKKVNFRPIASDSLVLITPKEHPLYERETIDFTDLEQYDFVMREEGSGTRKRMEEYLAVNGSDIERIRVSVSMGSTESVIACVEAGLGVAIISRLAAIPAVMAGRINMNESLPPFQRSFYFVTRKDGEGRPLQKAISTISFS